MCFVGVCGGGQGLPYLLPLSIGGLPPGYRAGRVGVVAHTRHLLPATLLVLVLIALVDGGGRSGSRSYSSSRPPLGGPQHLLLYVEEGGWGGHMGVGGQEVAGLLGLQPGRRFSHCYLTNKEGTRNNRKVVIVMFSHCHYYITMTTFLRHHALPY